MKRYNKILIRQIRKEIRLGSLVTPEQQEFLDAFGIDPWKQKPQVDKEYRILWVNNQIDGILRSLSKRKK